MDDAETMRLRDWETGRINQEVKKWWSYEVKRRNGYVCW